MAAIVNLPNLPSQSEPLQLADGSMNPVWRRYFVALDKALRAAT